MTDVKKDHNVGSGTGAAAGAVTGVAVGAVGGPIGMVVGGIIGGILGSKAGDSIAEAVNPTEYNKHWETNYRNADYYADGREWKDYEPAYGLGYRGYVQNREPFENVENKLEREWNEVKGDSRLAWSEARGAVRDGWHHVERALPGDFDRDGR